MLYLSSYHKIKLEAADKIQKQYSATYSCGMDFMENIKEIFTHNFTLSNTILNCAQ